MYKFNDLLDVLYQQTQKKFIDPVVDDVQYDPSMILTFSNNTCKVLHESKNNDKFRTKLIVHVLNLLKTDCKDILFFLDDYTKHIPDTNVRSACFAKKKAQSFITIPNAHWLMGFLDKVFSDVINYDIQFSEKIEKTIFAGGPNCEYGETRCRYVFSSLNNKKHDIFLCNNDAYRLPIEIQLQYKYLINIDGHGLCYDRLYWQMLSNSVPIYLEKKSDIFQIPDCFIEENINYIASSVENIDETLDYLNNTKSGKDHCLEIINNNKNFINEFFTQNPQQRSFEIMKFIFDSLKSN